MVCKHNFVCSIDYIHFTRHKWYDMSNDSTRYSDDVE